MPEDVIARIAERIREMRSILDLSVEEVAQRLGISIQEYEQYESGAKDLPISTLYRLAALFEVDFTVLLTGDSPRMETHTLVRKGEGVSVERYKGYAFESLAYNFKGRTMEPMMVDLLPGETPALVTHGGQEFNLVLAGHMQIVIGRRTFDLNEGDSIYFDPMIPHGQRAVEGPVRFLTVIQPETQRIGGSMS